MNLKPKNAVSAAPEARPSGVQGRSSERLLAISACVSATGFPSAAAPSVPTAVGYVALPRVIIFTHMACCSVVCILLCPLRPLIPKLTALVLAVNGLLSLLSCIGYSWLHLIYHV